MAAADSVDRRIPLFGRDTERAELVGVFERALGGGGGVAVVEGPAGIGKTRLISRAADLAVERGMVTFSASGNGLEQDYAYGAVRQLFEPLLGDPAVAELLAGPAGVAAAVLGRGDATADAIGGPGAVLHGLYLLTVGLAEQRGPLAVFGDDLHWFDSPSLRFIAYLANRVADLPIAVVLGTRPAPPGTEAEVLSRLLATQGMRRIRLAPLTRVAVGELVSWTLETDVSPDFRDAVADASSGNPFLVGELMRAARGAGPVPATLSADDLRSVNVGDAVLGRVAQLSNEAMEVARAVAVLGGDAHVRHVAAVAGVGPEEVGIIADGLLRAEILGPERPLAFVHPLVASAVYDKLLPGERSCRHRRAIDVLLAECTPVDRLAPHLMWVEPAADPAVVDILVAAARSAMAQGATDVGVAQLRRALLEPPSPERRLGVVLPLAIAESLLNDPGAIEHFGEVVEHIDDAGFKLRIATVRAAMFMMAGRWDEGLASMYEFDGRVAGDTSLRLQQLAGIVIASTVGRVPAERFVAVVDAFRTAMPPDRDAPADTLAIRALVGAAGGEPSGVAADLAARALGSIVDGDPTLPLWFHLCAAALTMADHDTVAMAAIERGLTSARRDGAPSQVGIMLFQRAAIELRSGDLEDALTDGSAALDICVESGLATVLPAPLSVVVDVLRERAQYGDAEALLAEHGFATGPIGGHDGVCQFDLLLRYARARLRGAQERWDESVRELGSGLELAIAAGCASPGTIAWRSALATALFRAGRATDAEAEARRALDEAVAFGAPRPLAAAQRALALAIADAGHSAALLEAATAGYTALGARLEVAHTCVLALELAVRSGAAPDVEQLGAALWAAEQCGAVALVRQCRDGLNKLGRRPRHLRPVAGAGSLTASERRVAVLASEGRTNKEIAQTLFVTVKTVETHLARTFLKLAISSRADLRRALANAGAGVDGAAGVVGSTARAGTP